MAYDKAADFLEPIDLAEHLDKIELYLGQVCQIAGISKMQLDYWTNKAQIPTKGNKQRIYDIDALETVMLISNGGTVIRMPVDEIKRLGRSTQGVIVMRLRGDEQVSSIALVAESEEPEPADVEAPDEPEPAVTAESDKNE